MILVSQRCPKQCHDPVAHDLVDRPLVTVHGFHHVFKDRIEKLSCIFGITVGKQFHGSLEVSEQHRDLLPLTFQGTFGRDDLLGEVLGGVSLERAKL
jgi:hypothetical protein